MWCGPNFQKNVARAIELLLKWRKSTFNLIFVIWLHLQAQISIIKFKGRLKYKRIKKSPKIIGSKLKCNIFSDCPRIFNRTQCFKSQKNRKSARSLTQKKISESKLTTGFIYTNIIQKAKLFHYKII